MTWLWDNDHVQQICCDAGGPVARHGSNRCGNLRRSGPFHAAGMRLFGRPKEAQRAGCYLDRKCSQSKIRTINRCCFESTHGVTSVVPVMLTWYFHISILLHAACVWQFKFRCFFNHSAIDSYWLPIGPIGSSNSVELRLHHDRLWASAPERNLPRSKRNQ